YAEGRNFVHAVVERVGMDGFNQVYASAENLPKLEEITNPEAWVARVHGPGRHNGGVSGKAGSQTSEAGTGDAGGGQGPRASTPPDRPARRLPPWPRSTPRRPRSGAPSATPRAP